MRHQLAHVQRDIRAAAVEYAIPLHTEPEPAWAHLPFVLPMADLYDELQQSDHGLTISALYQQGGATGPMEWHEVSAILPAVEPLPAADEPPWNNAAMGDHARRERAKVQAWFPDVFPAEYMFIDNIAPNHLRGMYYAAQNLSNVDREL